MVSSGKREAPYEEVECPGEGMSTHAPVPLAGFQQTVVRSHYTHVYWWAMFAVDSVGSTLSTSKTNVPLLDSVALKSEHTASLSVEEREVALSIVDVLAWALHGSQDESEAWSARCDRNPKDALMPPNVSKTAYFTLHFAYSTTKQLPIVVNIYPATMVSTHYSALLIVATTALVFQGHADASTCGADNYSKVASAVQTLHANCASGGVWTCDPTCHDAVANLVNELPGCTFGGPYGQNYKDMVEDMVATCGVNCRLTRAQLRLRRPLPVPPRRPRTRQLQFPERKNSSFRGNRV